MAIYLVTLKDTRPPNLRWNTLTKEVRAPSHKYAMTKAATNLNGNPRINRFVPIRVRIVKTDKDYWRKVWRKAFNNIPTRLMTQTLETWEKAGTVTVPDFIRESANGRMRQLEGHPVEKKIITKYHYKIGALAALTRLLGYARQSGKSAKYKGYSSMGHLTVLSNMTHGYRPRDEKRRELLLKLASKEGTKLALELLGQRFEPVRRNKAP